MRYIGFAILNKLKTCSAFFCQLTFKTDSLNLFLSHLNSIHLLMPSCKAFESWVGIKIPYSSLLISSDIPPTLEATIGTPHANASNTTFGHPSFLLGRQN